MILADTSAWIEHLRRGRTSLAGLLEEADVCVHPFVAGELACGRLTDRAQVLSLLQRLPSAPLVEHEEVLAFVEHRGLAGRGVGWGDVHLLASCVVGGHLLLTLDRRLSEVAQELDLAYRRT